jgi:adenylylsulfate kinase-like enzyme
VSKLRPILGELLAESIKILRETAATFRPRSSSPEGDFHEVMENIPASICSERGTKGLYKMAAAGPFPNLTVVNQSYDPLGI